MTVSGWARPWRPGIALIVSAVFHVALLIALVVRPAAWPQWTGLLLANHLILGLIGIWPRSRSLGENLLRLPEAAARRGEVALTFDDGPDPEVTPQVLDLLDRHQAKASFFVIGEKALAHPDLRRDIVRRGHSVENHSHRHSNFFGFFGWSALCREIGAAQAAIEGILGHRPAYFRSPMGIRNPLLDAVISKIGLRCIAWTRRGFDTLAHNPDKVLARLVRNLSAGNVLLMHDRKAGSRKPMVLTVPPPLLDHIATSGLRCVSLPMAHAKADTPIPVPTHSGVG